MIQRMSHVTLFVNNQQEAKAFYVDKLGFEVPPTTPWTAASDG